MKKCSSIYTACKHTSGDAQNKLVSCLTKEPSPIAPTCAGILRAQVPHMLPVSFDFSQPIDFGCIKHILKCSGYHWDLSNAQGHTMACPRCRRLRDAPLHDTAGLPTTAPPFSLHCAAYIRPQRIVALTCTRTAGQKLQQMCVAVTSWWTQLPQSFQNLPCRYSSTLSTSSSVHTSVPRFTAHLVSGAPFPVRVRSKLYAVSGEPACGTSVPRLLRTLRW